MSTETKEDHERNKEKAFSFLLVCSIISASLTALVTIPFSFCGSGCMGALVTSLSIQAALFIPATIVVNLIHFWTIRQNHYPSVEPVLRVLIPLITTIVAITISLNLLAFLGVFLGFGVFILVAILAVIWAVGKS